jgi:hypothetical protein
VSDVVRFGFQVHADAGRLTGIGRALISREVDEVERRTLAATFARAIEEALAAGIDAGAVDRASAALEELPVDGVTLEGFARLKVQNADGELVLEHGAATVA